MKNKRSGKFYVKNEREVMEMLGLEPTKGSGSGWIEKEDGQNDNFICQLKSTDKQSIKLNLLDIEKLEYNATVTNKIPIFAIQFLENNSETWKGTYLMLHPEDIIAVAELLNNQKLELNFNDIREKFLQMDYSILDKKNEAIEDAVSIKSSIEAKESFWEQQEREKKERAKEWKKKIRN